MVRIRYAKVPTRQYFNRSCKWFMLNGIEQSRIREISYKLGLTPVSGTIHQGDKPLNHRHKGISCIHVSVRLTPQYDTTRHSNVNIHNQKDTPFHRPYRPGKSGCRTGYSACSFFNRLTKLVISSLLVARIYRWKACTERCPERVMM